MGLDELKNKAKDGDDAERGETWKPKAVDDELAGTVVEIKYLDTQFGESYIINVRDEEQKLWTLWVTGIVLKGKLLEMAPGVGSLIVILYLGKQPTKSGDRSYNNFQVVVDKPNCHQEWIDAREAFKQRQLLGSPEVSHGGIAPPDDPMVVPF